MCCEVFCVSSSLEGGSCSILCFDILLLFTGASEATDFVLVVDTTCSFQSDRFVCLLFPNSTGARSNTDSLNFLLFRGTLAVDSRNHFAINSFTYFCAVPVAM